MLLILFGMLAMHGLLLIIPGLLRGPQKPLRGPQPSREEDSQPLGVLSSLCRIANSSVGEPEGGVSQIPWTPTHNSDVEVNCSELPQADLDRFRAFHGPNATMGICRYGCVTGTFSVEAEAPTHIWVIGRVGESCSAVCSAMAGCVQDASIWPRTPEAVGHIAERLLYRCHAISASAAPAGSAVPSLVGGECLWPSVLPAEPCGVEPAAGQGRLCPCGAPRMYSTLSKVDEAFVHSDLDGSGGLEPWEMAVYATSEEQAQATIRRMDKDDNGIVNLTEAQDYEYDQRMQQAAILHSSRASTSAEDVGGEGTRPSARSPNATEHGGRRATSMMELALTVAALIARRTIIPIIVGDQDHATSWQLAMQDSQWEGWPSSKTLDIATIESYLPDSSWQVQPPIGSLVTLGAPGAVKPALRNSRDPQQHGCYPGVRVVSERFRTSGWDTLLLGLIKRDCVPWLAAIAGYSHPAQTVLFLNDEDSEYSTFHSCDAQRDNARLPEIDYYDAAAADIHVGATYKRGMEELEDHAHADADHDSGCNSRGFRQAPGCYTSCYYGDWGDWCYTSRSGWWKRCEKCTTCSDGWELAPGCQQWVNYGGEWHYGCTTAGTADTLGKTFGWCSMDYYYQGNWRLCKSQCSEVRAFENAMAAWLKGLSQIITDVSYRQKGELGAVRVEAAALGFRVVAMAFSEEDGFGFDPHESWLLQHEESLRCVLTFAGTDSDGDAWTDLQFYPTAFCGLLEEEDEQHLRDNRHFTHNGFKYHLMRLVKSEQFQSIIRPKLQSCRDVSPVGHSLGGALATLFAACVNRAPQRGDAGYRDYAYMGWSSGSQPQLMPEYLG